MDITGTTKLYGLLGSPVEHSISPTMYNYCFEKWKIDCRYLAFRIARESAEEAVKAVRMLGLKGANKKAFPQREIGLYDLDSTEILGEKIQCSDILTNATKAGMKPLENISPIQDTSLFREELLVTDCIYDPQKTKLLLEAEKKGCRVMNGLEMLLFQGASALKLYTKRDMPVEEIRAHFFRAGA